jgi:hypothetical protein
MINKYYNYMVYPVYALTFFALGLDFITTESLGDSINPFLSLPYVAESMFALILAIFCFLDFVIYSFNGPLKVKSEIGLAWRVVLMGLAFIFLLARVQAITAINVQKEQQFDKIWKTRPIIPNANLSYVSNTDIKKDVVELGGPHALGAQLFFKNVVSLDYHVPMYLMRGLMLESVYVNRLQKHHLISEIPDHMQRFNSFRRVSDRRLSEYKTLSVSKYMHMSKHSARRYARAVFTVKCALKKGYNNEYLAAVIPISYLVKWQEKLKGSGFNFNSWLYQHLSSGSDNSVLNKFNEAIHPYEEQIACHKVLGSLCAQLAN